MKRPTRSAVRTSLVAVVSAAVVGLPGVAGAGSPLAAPAEAANPTPWWPAAMGFDDLARAEATGKGVTVAVIDGTIDPDAGDIKGRVASTFTPCTTAATGADADADHATEIAQVIVGTGVRSGGTAGVRGIAPDATLRHYSIGTGEHNDCGVDDADDRRSPLLIAMEKALADGAKVVNLSFGSSSTNDDELRAVVMAQHAGAIVVAATGDDSVSFPAAYNGVVAVNACDSKGQLDPRGANDGGYGIAFCAPGVGLVLGEHRVKMWVAQGKLVDGTSFAAPLVAGGLAAYWSKYPRASANQVLQAALRNPGMKQGTSNSGTKGWIAAYRRVGSGFPKIQDSTRTGFGWGVFAPADAVRVDPSTYPDTNPLLREANSLGPSAEEVAAGTLADDATSTTSPTGSSTTSAGPSSPSNQGSPSSPATSSDSASAGSSGDGGGGGFPAWAWITGLLVVVAAGAAFVVSRKGAAGMAATQPGEGS